MEAAGVVVERIRRRFGNWPVVTESLCSMLWLWLTCQLLLGQRISVTAGDEMVLAQGTLICLPFKTTCSSVLQHLCQAARHWTFAFYLFAWFFSWKAKAPRSLASVFKTTRVTRPERLTRRLDRLDRLAVRDLLGPGADWKLGSLKCFWMVKQIQPIQNIFNLETIPNLSLKSVAQVSEVPQKLRKLSVFSAKLLAAKKMYCWCLLNKLCLFQLLGSPEQHYASHEDSKEVAATPCPEEQGS